MRHVVSRLCLAGLSRGVWFSSIASPVAVQVCRRTGLLLVCIVASASPAPLKAAERSSPCILSSQTASQCDPINQTNPCPWRPTPIPWAPLRSQAMLWALPALWPARWPLRRPRRPTSAGSTCRQSAACDGGTDHVGGPRRLVADLPDRRELGDSRKDRGLCQLQPLHSGKRHQYRHHRHDDRRRNCNRCRRQFMALSTGRANRSCAKIVD